MLAGGLNTRPDAPELAAVRESFTDTFEVAGVATAPPSPRRTDRASTEVLEIGQSQDVEGLQTLLHAPGLAFCGHPLQHLGEDDVGEGDPGVSGNEARQFVDMWAIAPIEEVDPDGRVDDDHPVRLRLACCNRLAPLLQFHDVALKDPVDEYWKLQEGATASSRYDRLARTTSVTTTPTSPASVT